MIPDRKDLGVGVGLRPAHHSLFIEEQPSTVSWVEVVSENFMPWKGQDFGRPIQFLETVRKNLPIALHGVSLNIGSSDPLDFDYLKRLKSLIERIEPHIISDHLSWTGIKGENSHDLLPIPYTQEALELISTKLDQIQNFLGREILMENPSSYLEFKNSTMSEVEFLNELVKKTDCSLLLDVNNVYVSSVNHNFDPLEYLKQIPKNKVSQIHLAGHSQMNGYLIDTHDTSICSEVWVLYEWTLQNWGPRSTMIERDGNIPDWHELEFEILKLGEIHGKKSNSI